MATSPQGDLKDLEDDIQQEVTMNNYTAAVRKVLDHNRYIAEQNAENATVSAPLQSSIPERLDPNFTTLQRPVDFSVEWISSRELDFSPTAHLSFPHPTVGAPQAAYWSVHSTKYEATLARCFTMSPTQSVCDAVAIRVASYDYSAANNTHGPEICFERHEFQIIEQGAQKVIKFFDRMRLSKDTFGCTKYSVTLPASLDRMNVMWVFGHIDGFQDGRLHGNESVEADMAMREMAYKKKSARTSIGPAKKAAWTPYPTQHLMDAGSGRILATYTRSAPWSNSTSTLTIFPKILNVNTEQYEDLASDFIEGIITVTAAMIGTHQRAGLLSGLWEDCVEAMRSEKAPQEPIHSDP